MTNVKDIWRSSILFCVHRKKLKARIKLFYTKRYVEISMKDILIYLIQLDNFYYFFICKISLLFLLLIDFYLMNVIFIIYNFHTFY